MRCDARTLLRLPSGLPPRRRGRAATAVVELIVALPILLLVFLMLVQLGKFFLCLQQLEMASRTGALQASREPSLPGSGEVPAGVVDAVRHQLETSGIEYCRIRLEHNVSGGPRELSTEVAGCTCPAMAVLPPAERPPGEYVRVSVGVALDALLPSYCASLAGVLSPTATVGSTTVMRYEL